MSTKIHCDVCGQCLFDSTKDTFATCPHYPGYSIPQPPDEIIFLDVTTVKDIRNLLGFVANRDFLSIAALQNRFQDYVDKLNGLIAEKKK